MKHLAVMSMLALAFSGAMHAWLLTLRAERAGAARGLKTQLGRRPLLRE